MIMPEVGEEGQLRLKGASVVVAGGGGVGRSSRGPPAAAGGGPNGPGGRGAGGDSNLHRPLLLSGAGPGRPKAEVGKAARGGRGKGIRIG